MFARPAIPKFDEHGSTLPGEVSSGCFGEFGNVKCQNRWLTVLTFDITRRFSVFQAGCLARARDAWVSQQFGVVGLRSFHYRGILLASAESRKDASSAHWSGRFDHVKGCCYNSIKLYYFGAETRFGNKETWLILPVVICLFKRLSHACLRMNSSTVTLRTAH